MKKILDNHRSLMLLDEISKGGEITQRDLGFRLDMAVGLVNTYLKNLGTKGYIKISGIPPKRFKYYLTPKGFLEKSRLTYELLQNYTRVFKEARRDYMGLFQKLYADGVRSVFFAGADEIAEIAYLSLQEFDIEFIGAVDPDKAGENFFKTRIIGFDEMAKMPPPAAVVITTYNKKDIIQSKLAEILIAENRIHCVYPPTRKKRPKTMGKEDV